MDSHVQVLVPTYHSSKCPMCHSCNGAIVSDAEGGDVVQMSGDQRTNIHEFLVDQQICAASQVRPSDLKFSRRQSRPWCRVPSCLNAVADPAANGLLRRNLVLVEKKNNAILPQLFSNGLAVLFMISISSRICPSYKDRWDYTVRGICIVFIFRVHHEMYLIKHGEITFSRLSIP